VPLSEISEIDRAVELAQFAYLDKLIFRHIVYRQALDQVVLLKPADVVELSVRRTGVAMSSRPSPNLLQTADHGRSKIVAYEKSVHAVRVRPQIGIAALLAQLARCQDRAAEILPRIMCDQPGKVRPVWHCYRLEVSEDAIDLHDDDARVDARDRPQHPIIITVDINTQDT